MKHLCRKQWLWLIVLISVLLVGGCAQQAPPAPSSPAPVPSPPSEGPTVVPAWMEVELTDVNTGKKFRISDFKGKPVLMESFAVWCPTCLRQQKQMKKLIEKEGDAIVHISLDTDPNEDAAKVKEHLEKNGLDWYFVVSPVELTKALIDEFGLSVVSAPSAPVVLICEDQTSRFLKSGVKSADTLLDEVEKGCQ